MQMGDYTLGVWDLSVSTEETAIEKNDQIVKVFPNPSSGQFTFEINSDKAVELEIFSFDGRLIKSIQIQDKVKQVLWMPEDIPNGTYLAVLKGNQKRILASHKIVYSK